jgi:hypothetical protein
MFAAQFVQQLWSSAESAPTSRCGAAAAAAPGRPTAGRARGAGAPACTGKAAGRRPAGAVAAPLHRRRRPPPHSAPRSSPPPAARRAPVRPAAAACSAPSGKADHSGLACASMRERPSAVARSAPSAGLSTAGATAARPARRPLLEGLGAEFAHVAVGVVLGRQEQEAHLRRSVAWGSAASSARAAARRPAASPSKLNTTDVGEAEELLQVVGRAGRAQRGHGVAEADCASATTSM